MQIHVTFKTPDAVDEAIIEALDAAPKPDGLSDDEWQEVKESRLVKLKAQASKWFEWMEYVSVTWDTEKDTCTVNRKRS